LALPRRLARLGQHQLAISSGTYPGLGTGVQRHLPRSKPVHYAVSNVDLLVRSRRGCGRHVSAHAKQEQVFLSDEPLGHRHLGTSAAPAAVHATVAEPSSSDRRVTRLRRIRGTTAPRQLVFHLLAPHRRFVGNPHPTIHVRLANKPLKQTAAPRGHHHRVPLARGEVPRARSSLPVTFLFTAAAAA
jgi:hypothetical protein